MRPVTSANDNLQSLGSLRSVSCSIARSPDACWRVLIDVEQLEAWVPGLRRARVVSTGADGLPAEVVFEYSASLTYSLVYNYDLAERMVRWEPRTGKRDGVRGFARVEPAEGGSIVTYALEQGGGRTAADLALGDTEALIAAFARWMLRAA